MCSLLPNQLKGDIMALLYKTFKLHASSFHIELNILFYLCLPHIEDALCTYLGLRAELTLNVLLKIGAVLYITINLLFCRE